MSDKRYISAQELLDDSFALAMKVFESGFRPDYIVGIWRGGAPVGIAVQELLDYLGLHSDHIAIRTSSYTGIEERAKTVKVHGLTYVIKKVHSHESLLIVDDVHDTGLSIDQVIKDLHKACKKNTPEIRIACPYYKPGKNKTDRVPDYYVHETEEWLVFPHELKGLSVEEVIEHKPGIAHLKEKLAKLKADSEQGSED